MAKFNQKILIKYDKVNFNRDKAGTNRLLDLRPFIYYSSRPDRIALNSDQTFCHKIISKSSIIKSLSLIACCLLSIEICSVID